MTEIYLFDILINILVAFMNSLIRKEIDKQIYFLILYFSFFFLKGFSSL